VISSSTLTTSSTSKSAGVARASVRAARQRSSSTPLHRSWNLHARERCNVQRLAPPGAVDARSRYKGAPHPRAEARLTSARLGCFSRHTSKSNSSAA
jgi:hypothetical protein